MANTALRSTRSLTAALLLACTLLFSASPALARSVRQKKLAARSQFDIAQRLREELNGTPQDDRSERDYRRVTDAFRKVYYTAPTSSKADAAALAVAELLAESGRVLDQPKNFQAAIGQYEFLRREYPGSKYRFEALLAEAEIYRHDLNDSAKAKESYDEFLNRYPNHHLAQQAKDELAEMEEQAKHPKSTKQLAASKQKKLDSTKQSEAKRTSRSSESDDTDTESADARHTAHDSDVADLRTTDAPQDSRRTTHDARRNGRLPLVTGVRHWSTGDYTRVAIDLEDEVQYEAGRVPSPDRIFFDLHGTKLASELIGKSFEVQDGFLKRIRVAPFSQTVTRVVLEVDDVSEYSAFLLPNPYRLIIDIHGKRPSAAQTQIAAAQAITESKKSGGKEAAPVIEARPEAKRTSESAAAGSKPRATESATETSSKSAEDSDSSPTTSATEVASLSKHSDEVKATEKPTTEPTVEKVAPREGVTVIAAPKSPAPTETKSDTRADAKSDATSATKADSKSEAKPALAASARRRGRKASPAEIASIREAQPTADGERSLIRALGLKIGKIVVDAGHGGHDTGTIGPNGLLEKDLVLDVALRLGKELEQRLGAEVVYTRDDDTFIPLETRTAIANQNQADLFISIHANSSQDPAARGVETYYLNFTSSPDALDVAARENAVSENSIHELQDLVKKIALKEKIEESREFASDVQQSLHAGLAAKSPGLKDRGVKKAPFIVLIGANMPSILAEISFVSNPADEKKLKTGDYRQKIADSLYRGVARYVNSLSSVKVASAGSAPAAP